MTSPGLAYAGGGLIPQHNDFQSLVGLVFFQLRLKAELVSAWRWLRSVSPLPPTAENLRNNLQQCQFYSFFSHVRQGLDPVQGFELPSPHRRIATVYR